MRMHTFGSMVAVLALVAVVPTSAAPDQVQTQPPAQTPVKPEPKPEEKPEAKAATAATLAGKWNVEIQATNGPMQAALDVKADPKDAKKVAGTIVSPVGEATLEGEVVLGKLTFWFKMTANGNELSVTFVGTLQKDGSMAGTLSFGEGELQWTATREKK